MGKFKPINGWTKNTILAVIKARKYKFRAKEGGLCRYLTADGNKCAIGLFIPDGHPAQLIQADALGLVRTYPSLLKIMPLPLSALIELQRVHDDHDYSLVLFEDTVDVKAAMLAWVKENVQ